jgi:hypothetical protein
MKAAQMIELVALEVLGEHLAAVWERLEGNGTGCDRFLVRHDGSRLIQME